MKSRGAITTSGAKFRVGPGLEQLRETMKVSVRAVPEHHYAFIEVAFHLTPDCEVQHMLLGMQEGGTVQYQIDYRDTGGGGVEGGLAAFVGLGSKDVEVQSVLVQSVILRTFGLPRWEERG